MERVDLAVAPVWRRLAHLWIYRRLYISPFSKPLKVAWKSA